MSGRVRVRETIARLKATFHIQDVKFTRERLEEIGWLSGGQFATLLLSMVSIKLTTSIGPDEYGRFTLAASLMGVLSLSFFGPLEQGYIRFFFDYANEPRLRAAFCRSLLRVLAFSTLVLCLLSLLIGTMLYLLLNLDSYFSGAAALMIAVSLLSIPLNGMMNAMRLRKEVAVIQIIERLLIIGLLFVLLFHVASNASIVMSAIGGATAVSLSLRLVLFRKAGKLSVWRSAQEPSELRREIYKRIIQYSLPFVLWGAISWLQSNGERWVINGMLTSADVGRYGLAANIINSSGVLLFNIFSQFITPIIFNAFSNEPAVRSNKGVGLIRIYSLGTLALFGSVALALLLFGETLVHLLSNRDFVIDARLLFLLTCGLGLFYAGQTLTMVGLALKKPEAYLAAKIVAAILSVALYFAGCYWAGISGIVVAIVLVNAVYVLFVVMTNRTLLKLSV